MQKKYGDNHNPLVSIIVPCYNHQEFVGDCLESIIGQSYCNIEVLVVDDCSNDDSYEIIESFRERLEQRFETVYLKRNEKNIGLVKNLNRLVKQSNGKYIKIIASDDMLLPYAIEQMVLFAEERPNTNVFYSNAFYINRHHKYADLLQNNKTEQLSKYYSSKPLVGSGLTDALCRSSFICAPTAFIPVETYIKYNYYDENITFEDWAFWLKVSLDGTFDYCDAPTVGYRQLENSLSHFEGKKSFEKQNRFFEEKLVLLEQYRNKCSFVSYSLFLNDEFNYAVGNCNIKLAKRIKEYCKQNDVKISNYFMSKYVLLKLGIFPFIKKMIIKYKINK